MADRPPERPGLCGHHAGVFATLDHPNGTPVVDEDTRDVWASQLAGQCCRPLASKPDPTRPEETQPS